MQLPVAARSSVPVTTSTSASYETPTWTETRVRLRARTNVGYSALLKGRKRMARITVGLVGLGTVGATGLATGPHLHLELRIRGAAVNPLPAFR